MSDAIAARLAAAERRIAHLEGYVLTLEAGFARLMGKTDEASSFIQGLDALAALDEREREALADR